MSVRYVSHRQQVEARLERGIQAALDRAAFIMQQEIKLQLNKGASPPASAPGQPPHKRTGTLGRSVQVDRSGNRGRNPRVRIGPDLTLAPYARIHEFGGVIRPKTKKYLRFKVGNTWVLTKQVTMPARPYIRPAVKLARPKIRAQFAPERLLSGT